MSERKPQRPVTTVFTAIRSTTLPGLYHGYLKPGERLEIETDTARLYIQCRKNGATVVWRGDEVVWDSDTMKEEP